MTWRLIDSLPTAVIGKIKNKKFTTEGRRFQEFDALLDTHPFGPVWLKEPQVAAIVVAALKKLEEERLCQLHSYVIMPNHVHVLLAPVAALERITFLIKGRTARRTNLILSRTDKPFWQNESFDHWIRNPAEFERVRQYIEKNPVSAGLVAKPKDWPWSSASSTGFSRCADQSGDIPATEVKSTHYR